MAVVSTQPAAGASTELSTEVHAGDFAAGRPLPRCPGPFGGTTVLVLPEGLPASEVDAWLALEKDDPLAKQSRSIACGSWQLQETAHFPRCCPSF